MDYASQVPLPSLRATALGHFRVRAGRPVVPFSCSTKAQLESGRSCAIILILFRLAFIWLLSWEAG